MIRFPLGPLVVLLLHVPLPALGQFLALEQIGLDDHSALSLALDESGEVLGASYSGIYVYAGGTEWLKSEVAISGARLLATEDGDVFAAGGITSDTFRIVVTGPNGLSWTEVLRHATQDPVYGGGDHTQVMDFVQSRAGVLGVLTATLQTPAVNYGQLHLSKDRGKTWTSVPAPHSWSAALAPDGGLLVGTTYGLIYRSADEGGTWEIVHNTHGRLVVGIVADKSGLMYAASTGVDGGLSVSHDNGRSWIKESSVMGPFVAICADRDKNVLALHSTGKLYAPSNGAYDTIAEIDIDSLRVYTSSVDNSGRLLIGTLDRGVYRTIEAVATGVQDIARDRSEFRLSVFPNPAQDWLSLEIAIEAALGVRIDIVDILGRQRLVLHDGHLAPGSHTIGADVSALESGSYFVRASVTGGAMIRKIILVK
jgi:photosystem II stability/assembly factor-like uncharacterized protein